MLDKCLQVFNLLTILCLVYKIMCFQFYETNRLMCKLTDMTDNQIKIQLFDFSLIGRAKDWLQYLPNITIQIWKELVDRFLYRFSQTSSLQKEDHKSSVSTKVILSHCVMHGKDLSCSSESALITILAIWSRHVLPKVSSFIRECFWMPHLKVPW